MITPRPALINNLCGDTVESKLNITSAQRGGLVVSQKPGIMTEAAAKIIVFITAGRDEIKTASEMNIIITIIAVFIACIVAVTFIAHQRNQDHRYFHPA